jgi:hypothetical protein
MTYKFRFITAPLLAQYKGLKSRAGVFRRLENLYDQCYLGKHQERNDHFQNKGSRYYLLPKALIYLRDYHQINDPALHAMYKNKSVDTAYIDHSIDILRVYLSLRSSYPKVFHIYTVNELSGYDYFPLPKPDLYLNRIKPSKSSPNDYLIYIYRDVQLFVIKKHFVKILEHFDSGEWEAATATNYPTIILACPNDRIENNLKTFITKVLDNAGIDDLPILTTTSNTRKISALF